MVDPRPSKATREMVRQLDRLRGRAIRSFSAVEYLLADVVIGCRRFPAYSVHTKTLPYKPRTRLSRVKAICAMPGPLAQYHDRVATILHEFPQYELARNFMCHSIMSAKRRGLGSPCFELRMYAFDKSNPERNGIAKLDLADFRRISDRITSFATDTLKLLKEIYLTERLEQLDANKPQPVSVVLLPS